VGYQQRIATRIGYKKRATKKGKQHSTVDRREKQPQKFNAHFEVNLFFSSRSSDVWCLH